MGARRSLSGPSTAAPGMSSHYCAHGPSSAPANTMPERIQLRREKGWRKPADAVVVARPSRWGNPIVVGTHAGLSGIDREGHWYSCEITVTQDIAVAAFRDLMIIRLTVTAPDDPEELRYVQDWRAAVLDLRGRDLACWCPLTRDGRLVPCHADVLLELANQDEPIIWPGPS